jgi:hypothetical protein
MYVLGKMVTFEERLAAMNDRLLRVTERYEDVSERLARLEGKFELLEHMGATRRKRLPPE